jgi:hypothetical protein
MNVMFYSRNSLKSYTNSEVVYQSIIREATNQYAGQPKDQYVCSCMNRQYRPTMQT